MTKSDMYDLELKFERVAEGAILPEYGSNLAAGIDVFACLRNEDGSPLDAIMVSPGETVSIGIGYIAGIPDGWELQMRPRSGMSKNTMLRISNSPGTIDSDYKDEIKVLITNISEIDYCVHDTVLGVKGVESPNYMEQHSFYIIKNGDKIAQLVPSPRYRAKITEGCVDKTVNRGGGFGHSGHHGSIQQEILVS